MMANDFGSSSSTTNDENKKSQRSGSSANCSGKSTSAWEKATDNYVKNPLLQFVLVVALISARNPKRTIVFVIVLSITLVVTGFFTNFRIVADGEELWAPVGTRSLRHGKWIEHESGFRNTNSGYVAFLVHSNGNNVLTIEGANCLFDVVDTIRNINGYHKTCYESWGTEDQECPIQAASALFNHNRSEFYSNLARFDLTDELVQKAMSRLKYPKNDEPVVRDVIFGYPEPTLQSNITSDDISLLTSAQSYLGFIPKSESDEYYFEYDAVVALYQLQDTWDQQGIQCHVEANSFRALDDENTRGVEKDVPMMATAFLLMGIVCAVHLSNIQNLVQSRTILGLGAVVTIALSIMTSYGLLFVIGVPFTAVAQVFLYVMVGIGLDDTFIITGAFLSRTDPTKDIVDRVEDCMQEVGISIVVSTLTTVVAFSMGCATSMPMIRWFCIYAAPTVLIDFIYQISFFVAVMVLDDQRVQNHRYDCLVCVVRKKSNNENAEAEGELQQQQQEEQIVPRSLSHGPSWATKFMSRYSNILLRPATKALVLILFSLMLGLGIYGATKQTQELDFRDMMPPDSFIRTYYGAMHEYASEYSYTAYCIFAAMYTFEMWMYHLLIFKGR
jgi:hypothetical protein